MSKKYALKAINDDTDYCEVCGKQHLKRVMWIVELDKDGGVLSDPFPCGTSCGSKILGYTHSKVQTKVNNFNSEVLKKRQYLLESRPEFKNYQAKQKQLNAMKIWGNERVNHPLYADMQKSFDIAKDWANSQEILIEL